MRVVLRADVGGVGKKGDILQVADGYARNYLIPHGRAMKATAGVEAQAKAMRRSRDLKDARDREAAETVASKLVPMVIRLAVKAGPEGRLFGSVTVGDVADAVAAQSGIDLDRRRLRTDEPIKAVGTHEVAVKLHADVEFRLNVEVVAAER
ncbi:MAG: 50S ribosomal protein L9 [Acidimicrobiales bacterium]